MAMGQGSSLPPHKTGPPRPTVSVQVCTYIRLVGTRESFLAPQTRLGRGSSRSGAQGLGDTPCLLFHACLPC